MGPGGHNEGLYMYKRLEVKEKEKLGSFYWSSLQFPLQTRKFNLAAYIP